MKEVDYKKVVLDALTEKVHIERKRFFDSKKLSVVEQVRIQSDYLVSLVKYFDARQSLDSELIDRKNRHDA